MVKRGKSGNPRYANGSERRANRRRLRNEERPCWICEAFGRPSRIDYYLPAGHPGAFEVDELIPVSRWREGGYRSPEACASDYGNLAATHRACNGWRGNKSVAEVLRIAARERGQVEDTRFPQPWGV